MSQENVETVRRLIERLSDLDPEGIDDFLAEFWEEDSDYYPVRKWPEASPCHGRGEIGRFISRYMESWVSFELSFEELFAVGDDRVLSCGAMSAEGRESGLELGGPLYVCYWLRHGRVFRQEDHLTVPGALRALGLDGGTLEEAGLR